MVPFTKYLEETKKTGCTCWTGYKRVPGTKPCSPGSCVKESVELDEAGNVGDSLGYLTPAERAKEIARRKAKIASNTTPASKAFVDKALKKPVNEEAESQFDLIEEVIEELALAEGLDSEAIWETLEEVSDQELLEYAIDKKGYKSSTGGLTQKGVDAYNAKTGGNLKTAVTTKPSKLKPGSKAANRRKSFCARMSGMEGAMKKPNGEPTRKALALRKWNC